MTRHQIIKLTKGHSTKSERKFMELCKKLRIPFKAKVKIQGREIDFLVGKYAIEIDAHSQDVEKNWMLIHEGYSPIHLANWDINENLEWWLTKIWDKERDRVYSHRRERQ